ncbi:multidrug efflux MFS transporter [soil metagenome]
MESSSAQKPPLTRQYAALLLLRVGGGTSGLVASYALVSHAGRSWGSSETIGIMSAASNGSEMVAAVLTSCFVSMYSRRSTLLIAAICGLLAVLAGMIPGIELIWATRILDGFIAGVATTSLLSSVLREGSQNVRKRGRLVSSFEGVLIVGVAFGAILAAVLWPKVGLSTYIAVGLLYFASGALLASTSRTKTISLARVRLGRPHIVMGALVAMAISASMWLSQVGFLFTGPRRFGQWIPGSLTQSQVPIVLIGYLVIASIGLGIWAQVLRKWTTSRGVKIAVSGAVLAPLILLGANVAAPSPMRWILLLIYVACVLIQVGLVPCILAALSSKGSDGDAADPSGWYVAATASGNIVGPLMGGVLAARWGASGLCLGSFTCAVVAAALIFTWTGIKEK